MEITVFAKKRNTKEGKVFYSFLSRLTKKDGTIVPVSLKFREECGNPDPKSCPMNIVVGKKDANLSENQYPNEKTGEINRSYTLWVSNWKPGTKYEDTSLDEFDM